MQMRRASYLPLLLVGLICHGHYVLSTDPDVYAGLQNVETQHATEYDTHF